MNQEKKTAHQPYKSALKSSSITFQVEKLARPSTLVDEKSLKEVFSYFHKEKVEVHSPLPEQIVSFGYHSFIYGMYQAYADHRPFVLSPDMIWTLILQGFSHHVNFNKDTANDLFPGLSKRELIVRMDTDTDDLQDLPWDSIMEQYTGEIAGYVGDELINTMQSNFSTTGTTEKLVSEITVMNSMKAYFEYIIIFCVCGIPEVTLEGNIDDWQKLKAKMQVFRKYGLSWWIDLLDPIIDQFTLAYQTSIDKDFWMNMFKIHSSKAYGNPKIIDGWIFKFFPYDVDGNQLPSSGNWKIDIDNVEKVLPKEMVAVDLTLKIANGKTILEQRKLLCWAGFIGLSQHPDSFALRPELAWLITPNDGNTVEPRMEDGDTFDGKEDRHYKQLDSFPEELTTGEWGEIYLYFKQDIHLPKKSIDAKILVFHGQYSEEHLERLKKIFKYKNCCLVVNNEWFLPTISPLVVTLGLRDYIFPNPFAHINRWLGRNKWEKLDANEYC